MARCEVFVDTVPALGGGVSVPLARAWVYLRDGSSITVLRTDPRGMLISRSDGGPVDEWWQYSTPFLADLGEQLELCFSRGELPIPNDRLLSELFTSLVLKLKKNQRKGRVVSNGGVTNSIRLAEAIVELRDAGIRLKDPVELTPWMLELQTLDDDDPYYLEGIAQGAALFKGKSNIDLTEKEFDPNDPAQFSAKSPRLTTAAAAPAPSLDVPSRGFVVRGGVSSGVSSVKVRLFNGKGELIPLYKGETLDHVDEVDATLDDGDLGRTFEAFVFVRDGLDGDGKVGDHFGLIQIAVITDGLGAPFQDWFTVYFCAAQLALADDADAEADGKGRLLGPAEELRVVEFDPPGAKSAADAKQNALARRMHAYPIRTRVRDGQTLPEQEMPMFMAELQLLGVTQAALGRMMQHQYFRKTGGVIDPFNATIDLELSWRRSLTLRWVARNGAKYQTVPFFEDATGSVVLPFDDAGKLCSPGTSTPLADNVSEVPNALRPAPQQLPFPVPGRRLPGVRFGEKRSWGRHREKTEIDALVIEMQPKIDDGTLRGGTGQLELAQLDFGVSVPGQPVKEEDRVGMSLARANRVAPSTANTVAKKVEARRGTSEVQTALDGVAENPALFMPLFRVGGVNIPQTTVIEMLRTTVDKFFKDQAKDLLVFAPVSFWIETALMTVVPEAGGTMFTRNSNRGTFVHPNTDSGFFGVEAGMPVFGPPSGYGVCQLDPPIRPPVAGTGDDRLWSYPQNLLAGSKLLRDAAKQLLAEWDKGTHYTEVKRTKITETGALTVVSTKAAEDAWKAVRASQTGRAMLQRALVRSFGGGKEFTFFAATNKWDVWVDRSRKFWDIHVNDKIAKRMKQLGLPYVPVVHRETPIEQAGQGTFGPQSFGPGT